MSHDLFKLFVLLFFRYSHHFLEFGKFIDEHRLNIFEKSTVALDSSLPSYGTILFNQNNYYEKINSEVTCNQLFLYKTPSLGDDACQGESVKTCDSDSVFCNQKSKEIQNTIKPISSILSVVTADKNKVAVEPTEKR